MQQGRAVSQRERKKREEEKRDQTSNFHWTAGREKIWVESPVKSKRESIHWKNEMVDEVCASPGTKLEL